MTPREALEDLFVQHSELREIISVCELLADQLDAGQIEPGELTREVTHLRGAFDSHTRFEEEFLRPILREADRFGTIAIDEILVAHVREHHSMQTRLSPTITMELRLTLEALRAHLEAEEAHFVRGR